MIATSGFSRDQEQRLERVNSHTMTLVYYPISTPTELPRNEYTYATCDCSANYGSYSYRRYDEEDAPRIPKFWELPPKIPIKKIRPRKTRRFRIQSPRVVFQPCWRSGRWKSRT